MLFMTPLSLCVCVCVSTAKYQLNYHDVRSLHYLSQGMEPSETVPQLQSRFEAWKVSWFSYTHTHTHTRSNQPL